MNTKTKALWALLAISILWGTTWFVSKLTISDIPPLQMSAVRQTIAGLILIIYFFIKGEKIPSLPDLKFHILMGFLLISCSNGLTTWAIKYIPSYLGALLSSLMPFLMLIENYIFTKQKVKPISLIGLIIGFLGVALLMSSFIEDFSNDNFVFGIIICLVGVLTWTSGTLLTVFNKRQLDPFTSIGWQMFFGGIILFIAVYASGQHVPIQTVPLSTWLWISYLIMIGSIFCFMCYLYALKYLSLDLVSIYVYINPLIALIMGILFLKEKLTLSIVSGALVILAGVYIVKKSTAVK